MSGGGGDGEYTQLEDGKIAKVQNQVKQVKGIMRENIQSVIKRGETLDQTLDQTEELADASQNFKSTSQQVRMAMCWQYVKTNIILVCTVLILLAIIITIAVCTTGGCKKK